MKRFWGLAFLLCVVTCAASAQVVDTTVCAVLANPAGFNGKTVRIKGTVESNFDQFVVSDGSCGNNVNGIWLAYPQGTKVKSGPVAMLELQPAHNFAGKAAAVTRPAVTLTRDKAFKQFDSLLSQKHDQESGLCIGCMRYQVQATLVGRLDGVSDASVERDGQGKIVGLGGFGNLNAYPARLVLESVTDVTSKAIDYSSSDAIVKKAMSNSNGPNQSYGNSQDEGYSDPIDTMAKLAAKMPPSQVTTQIQSDLALLPKNKQQNGVTIGYGAMNEVGTEEGAPGAQDSPDGVLYKCTLNRDRLPGLALSMALMHLAQHIADVRSPKPGNENAPLYFLESNAWAVTATIAVSGGERFLTLPGGYMMWDLSWPADDRLKNMEAALSDFLTKEELLTK